MLAGISRLKSVLTRQYCYLYISAANRRTQKRRLSNIPSYHRQITKTKSKIPDKRYQTSNVEFCVLLVFDFV